MSAKCLPKALASRFGMGRTLLPCGYRAKPRNGKGSREIYQETRNDEKPEVAVEFKEDERQFA